MCLLVTRVLVLAYLTLLPGIAGADGPPKAVPAPRTDLYGDPLPDGALARLGSVRLRHAGLSDFVVLPGGRTVLSTGGDRVLRFWDLATGRQERAVKLGGTASPARCATLAPDGKTLVAFDRDRLVFWEVDSGKEVKTLPGPRANLAWLRFAP